MPFSHHWSFPITSSYVGSLNSRALLLGGKKGLEYIQILLNYPYGTLTSDPMPWLPKNYFCSHESTVYQLMQ